MADNSNLLVGNGTAAGQGFRAPGFDAQTSLDRTQAANQKLQGAPSLTSMTSNIPFLKGGKSKGLIDPRAFAALLKIGRKPRRGQ